VLAASVLKGIACRTPRSAAPRAPRPEGTLSRKTSPLNSPVIGGLNVAKGPPAGLKSAPLRDLHGLVPLQRLGADSGVADQ